MSRYTKRELKWTRLKLKNTEDYVGMQEELICKLKERVEELEEELLKWQTGQHQTSRHYNAYRDRGVELFEKDQLIQRYKQALEDLSFTDDEEILRVISEALKDTSQ